MGRLLALPGTLEPPQPRCLLATAAARFPQSPPWLKVLKTLVVYRLLAPGSERMSEIQMIDVIIPATDGRELRMKHYTKPEKVHQLLLDQLGFTLPGQPPPEIRNPKHVVETYCRACPKFGRF